MDANGNPPYNRRGRPARGEAKGESGAALWGVLAGGSQARRLQLVPRRRRSPFWAPPREEESARGRRGWLRRRTPAASKVRRAGWFFFLVAVPFRSNPPALVLGLPRRVFRGRAAVHIEKLWVATPRYTREWVCLGGRKLSSRYGARKPPPPPALSPLRPQSLAPNCVFEREAWRALAASFARGP